MKKIERYKTKAIFLTLLLVLTLIPISQNIKADNFENFNDVEFDFKCFPSNENLFDPDEINVSIYIAANSTNTTNAFSTDLISFSEDTLYCTQISKGNILNGTGFEIWSDGTIDNTNGTITDVFWAWSGENASEGNGGYFANLSFDVIGSGKAYVNINQALAAYDEEYRTSTISQNYSAFYRDITVKDEYPHNNSDGMNRTELFSINVSDANGDPITVFWYSNITGTTKLLGYNLSVANGTYECSCYGVVDSPYGRTIMYDFKDRQSTKFVNNTCPGAQLGTINKVEIYAPSYSGPATPIFDGLREGSQYTIPSAEHRVDITEDRYAPTEWTWDDIKDLEVEIADTDTKIIVTYDVKYGFGEKIYWTVNVTDGQHWQNESFSYEIKDFRPYINNPSPYDAEIVTNKNFTLSAEVIDFQGDMMNVSFLTNKSGTWDELGSTQNGGNGTYIQDISVSNFSTWYWWRIVASDNGNDTVKTYRFKTRDAYEPNEPKNMSVVATNETSVTIEYETDAMTDYTLIKRRTDRYPTFSDPGELYYGSDNNFTDTECSPGTYYYYRAWAYNGTDDIWSEVTTSENCSNKTLTYPHKPSNLSAETASYYQINLTWDKGTGAEKTIIRRKEGSYPNDYNDGTLIYDGIAESYNDDDSMGGNITYFYRAWSYINQNSIERYSLDYNESYNTTLVGPPTINTNKVTYINVNDVVLNAYLLSDGGETATCGFKWGNESYHENVTIGTKTTDEYFDHNIHNLSYATSYYVQAWAKNSHGYMEGSNVSFWTTPINPENILAETVDDHSIDLTWDKGEGADTTVIVSNKSSYPTNLEDGLIIYNDTGNNFIADYSVEGIPVPYEYHAGLHQSITPLCHWEEPTPLYDDKQLYGSRWGAQTFTVGYRGSNEYHYLRKVSLRLWRTGNPGPITLIVSNATKIEDYRVTSRGNSYDLVEPKNDDILITKEINAYTQIGESNTPGEWVDFEFDDPILLEKGEQYTLILKAPWATSTDSVYWVKDSVHSSYGSGDSFLSTDSGSNWNELYYQYSGTWGYQYGRADFNFKCFGNQRAGLESNTTYYFSAWSYNSSQNVYSDYKISDHNTTDVGMPSIDALYPENINDTSTTFKSQIIFDRNDDCTAGVIYGTSRNNLNHNVTATGKYNSGDIVNINVSDLSIGNKWYYASWVKNDAGYYYDYPEYFYTKPQTPSSFSSNAWGAHQINLSWNKGLGTDRTIIRRKIGSYPAHLSDGIERYNGSAESFIDHFTNTEGKKITEPMEENTNYYYRAWSYNISNGLNSNLYGDTQVTTENEPQISNMNPGDYEVNIDTPAQLSVDVSSSNEPINVTFYSPYSLDLSKKQLVDDGSGWSDADEISNTETGYYSTRTSYCNENDYSYERKFAHTHKSGYNTIQTPKLTAYLDHPKLITGIHFSYGKYYYPDGGGYYRLDGTKTWHMEYHDFYNDTWIQSNDYADWGDNQIYTNGLIVVDKVRIWLKSTTYGSEKIHIDPRVNYVYFAPPDEIESVQTTSGNTASITWDETNEENSIYYWTAGLNDGRTIKGTPINYFITESFSFSNIEPSGTVQDTYSHNCSLDVSHSRGDVFNLSLYKKVGSNWILEKSYNNVTDGSFYFMFNDSDSHGTTYYWKAIADDGSINHTEEYSFYVRASYVPNTPPISATTTDPETITITGLTSSSYANSIMLRYKETGYPSSRSDGSLLQNNTSDSYTHENRELGQTYYYSAWAWNMTDNVWSSRGTDFASTPGPTASFTASTRNKTAIDINEIDGNEHTDYVMIRYSSSTHPEEINDGSLVINAPVPSISSTIHDGLSQRNEYYYSAWGYNETFNIWSNRVTDTARTEGIVSVSGYTPSDGQEGVGFNPSLSVTVNDYEPDSKVDIIYKSNTSGSWTTIGTKSNVGDGTYSISTSGFDEQLTWYWYEIDVIDGNDYVNKTLKFKTQSVLPPTALTATTPRELHKINLEWNNEPDADKTVITRKSGSYPSSPSDGTIIVDGNSESYSDTGLDNGKLYYYRAWSYRDGLYSESNAETVNLTIPLAPTNIHATPSGHRSMNLTWTKGDGADRTYIVMDEDFYPKDMNDTLAYNGPNNHCTVTGLMPGDYLNYFTPIGKNNTIGYSLTGGIFDNAVDGNTNTKWDLQSNTEGIFSFIFNISNADNTQEMDAAQRIYSYKMLHRDFYNDIGETWNASITEAKTYNSSWNMFWEGNQFNTNSSKQWWVQKTDIDHKDITEIEFNAWVDYITPDIYEVELGKLGYTYKFKAWSIAEGEGIEQISLTNVDTANRTEDNPINTIPEISNMNPENKSANITLKPAILNVTINDIEGDLMTICWQTNKSGEWQTFETQTGLTNGTYSISTYTFDEFDKRYWWRVNVSDDSDSRDSVYSDYYNISEIYHFDTRSPIDITPPSNFTATLTDLRDISLSWDYEMNADKTIIVAKSGSYPKNMSDGTMIFNGTANTTEYNDLEPGTGYYFKAWGWNNFDEISSENHSATMINTGGNQKPVVISIDPTNNSLDIDRYIGQVSVNISDGDADPLDWHIWGDFGINSSADLDTQGIKTADLPETLPGDITVNWNISIFDGYVWTNESYSFTTETNYAPEISNPNPLNESEDVSTGINYVSILITDANNESFNYTIHGTNITHTTVTNAINGTKQAEISTLGSNSTVVWYVNVTDGFKWTNKTFWFNTSDNNAPNQPMNEIPINNSDYESVYTVYLNVTVSDPDGGILDVDYYWGNGTYIGNTTGIANNSISSLFLPDYINPDWLNHNTEYVWYVNVTDGMDHTTGPEWKFITSMAPDTDENKKVDITDVSKTVSNYGVSCLPGELPTDIDNTGSVDISDVSIVVSNYGVSY
jgi:hypothetical protein